MNHDSPNVVIGIVGPTAVGKTALAVELADRLGGEIVSADSRQVYMYMDIGTAKPSQSELSRVRHHLIDIRTPNEWITLAEYQFLANKAIAEIHAAGKVPLLVGGTGQYVKAVLEGWRIPQVPPNDELRRKLEARAEALGHLALHEELAKVDHIAAKAIDSRNVRRVIRALEVYYVTGTPITSLQGREPPAFRVVQLGLTRPRPKLYEMIDERINKMFEAGLVKEVSRLVEAGYSWSLPAMSSLGYRQMQPLMDGKMSLDETIASIKRDTRTFVRMQYNWFKLSDNQLRWFDLDDLPQKGHVEGMIDLLRQINPR